MKMYYFLDTTPTLVSCVDDAIKPRLNNDYDYDLIPKCNTNALIASCSMFDAGSNGKRDHKIYLLCFYYAFS